MSSIYQRFNLKKLLSIIHLFYKHYKEPTLCFSDAKANNALSLLISFIIFLIRSELEYFAFAIFPSYVYLPWAATKMQTSTEANEINHLDEDHSFNNILSYI